MNVKKVGTAAVMVGAFSVPVLLGAGLGTGEAAADQSLGSSPGVTFKLDRPHDHWDDWYKPRGPRWRGGPPPPPPAYYGGACAWVPPAVSAWVPPAVC